ncbi:OmpH family outer membrane protein, partial [Dysgonomonas sp. Marseille-P4677]|uniref:OmpH family outer membrane protein n=1 Tax=Dysgonomonas sp. Marseille-P4677 TaxID=2364790 RepID=UPI0019137919
AYINVDEIFSKMPELKEVENKIATKTEAIRKAIDNMESEFQKKLKEFEDSSTQNLPEAVVLDQKKQVQDFQDRYRTFVQSSQQELEKEQNSLMAPLEQKLRKAIKDVGDENNYSLILNSNTILHIGSDVTDANGLVKAKLGIIN